MSLQLSFAAVPQGLRNKPALRELTLDQCCPSSEELRAFSGLTALQSLRLCNNRGSGEETFAARLTHLALAPATTRLLLDGNGLPHLRGLQAAALRQIELLDVKAEQVHLSVVYLPCVLSSVLLAMWFPVMCDTTHRHLHSACAQSLTVAAGCRPSLALTTSCRRAARSTCHTTRACA